MWVKPSAEQQFLYGHHVMKSGLGRITDATDQYQGVVVYSMSDLPLVRIVVYFRKNYFTTLRLAKRISLDYFRALV